MFYLYRVSLEKELSAIKVFGKWKKVQFLINCLGVSQNVVYKSFTLLQLLIGEKGARATEGFIKIVR